MSSSAGANWHNQRRSVGKAVSNWRGECAWCVPKLLPLLPEAGVQNCLVIPRGNNELANYSGHQLTTYHPHSDELRQELVV
jgi:hypothetical protein